MAGLPSWARGGQLHPDEEIVLAVAEQFEADIEMITTFLNEGGRPLFTVKLTPEEMLARFLNPVTQRETLDKLVSTGDDELASSYLNRMTKYVHEMTESPPPGDRLVP